MLWQCWIQSIRAIVGQAWGLSFVINARHF